VEAFDLTGKCIADGLIKAGEYSCYLDMGNFPQSIYIIRVGKYIEKDVEILIFSISFFSTTKVQEEEFEPLT